MERKNNQQLAIVTGGASGIGLAIARRFVEAGIFTIVIGRDTGKLEQAKKELGDNCATFSADLSVLDTVPALISQIEKEYGPIDILVNNAGINMKKEFIDVSDEDFQKIILTNLQSVFSVSREVVKLMTPRQSGCIINISSMAARYGIPKVIAYTASKSAIEGMTKAMAVELAPKGIRVNCIAPGFIATDMSAKALDSDPERKQKVMSRTPMGKLGTPADIGNTALYLASSEAGYVTGVSIAVDGGNSIGF